MKFWETAHRHCRKESLPVRGAWIEISLRCKPGRLSVRRSPCGERGLKFSTSIHPPKSPALSLPVRGAWIEIYSIDLLRNPALSLPVRGAWIEIHSAAMIATLSPSRSPCGERGLKCIADALGVEDIRTSLPVRGAWIEIIRRCSALASRYSRSPCGERGLKCVKTWFTP